ncbi:hypothetical protein LTR37_014766 [Vermiconidia calcicola]|uniref:Uncharacterized protein n=1 Tax=Vermiconidia calcicola TaxID=1690605 RepID=A0ACC3MSL9_9PEZI|nr:hypothetical protein LTR37_014766 [Vermiconidia calcicola]
MNAEAYGSAISLDSSEGDDLLDGDLDVRRRPPSSRLRRWANFSVLWWLSNVVMGIVIIYLGFQLDAKRTLLGRFELAGDTNGVWPRLPHRVVTFKPDNRYVRNLTSPTFKEDTREHWLNILPSVPNPGKYPHLPTPYMKDDKAVYMTSVTHQLHCLYTIMHSINDLLLNDGSFTIDIDDDGNESSMHGIDGQAAQLSHCFDYLRQSIMCHGDTALEGAHPTNTKGPGIGGDDGWNVRHVCKPWKPIHNWLEKKRIDDNLWD